MICEIAGGIAAAADKNKVHTSIVLCQGSVIVFCRYMCSWRAYFGIVLMRHLVNITIQRTTVRETHGINFRKM